MANIEIKTPLVDFKKHLQEVLDEKAQDVFVVSNVRNMNTDKDKINVVITALAGSVYHNSATIPYVVEVVSNKPEQIINIFTAIAKERNNKSFIEVIEEEEEAKEYTVFEFYSTPSIAEKDNDYEINHICRLVMYVDLNVLFEVGNVSSIKIDGEEIEFADGSFNYAIESFSLRDGTSELNKTCKKTATTSLHFAMVNKICPFTNKVFKIMFGMLKGNTKFECEIRLTNGFVGNATMILHDNSFKFAKNSPTLPSLDITLTRTKDN